MPSTPAIPPGIFCAQDYEALARQVLPLPIFEHLVGGSGRDLTAAANRAAFDAFTVTPRVLHNVSHGNAAAKLGEETRAHPLILAPVAFQHLFHPGAEIETARAAHATGTAFIASTLSSHRLEEIAGAASPDRWFQLYFQPVRDSTLDLIRRAEAAGYRALVATVDTPVKTPSLRALRAGFADDDGRAANLAAYPPPPMRTLSPGDSRILQGAMDGAPTWEDIDWLMTQTALPVWIKGVLHPQDAKDCKAKGAAGVVVSNHGGRSLDGAPASLAALPAVRQAVGDDYPVLFDGGVRSGSDVFKAIALGADSVLIGRLQAYGLAVAGALGVGHVIKLLREELELCMALAGCATLAEVRAAEVRSAPRYDEGRPTC